MEYWAFTVKYNKNDLTDDEYRYQYDQILHHWSKNGVVIENVTYEDLTKSKERTKLHLHGRCGIKRGLYRKKLMMKDFHIKLVAWRTTGWTDYCNKNKIVAKMFDNISVPDKVAERSVAPCPELGGLTDEDGQPIVIPRRRLF